MSLQRMKIATIKFEGAPGFEPGTSRSAVECSTTELYPHVGKAGKVVILLQQIFKDCIPIFSS